MKQRHARAVMQVMANYARRRTSLSKAALAGATHFVEWRHYPATDAVDTDHRTEFYYHAHGVSKRATDEHGHFHVFARTYGGRRFHHLVGISMNPLGLPSRLFLTNQWVTGEAWISAGSVASLLNRFDCRLQGRLAPVGRWITGMVHLYREEIDHLHYQREAWLAARSKRMDRHDVLSDPRHHIVAQKRIDLIGRLSKVLM